MQRTLVEKLAESTHDWGSLTLEKGIYTKTYRTCGEIRAWFKGTPEPIDGPVAVPTGLQSSNESSGAPGALAAIGKALFGTEDRCRDFLLACSRPPLAPRHRFRDRIRAWLRKGKETDG